MNADTETRALTSGLLGGNLICLSPLLSSTAHRYQSPVLSGCARAEFAGDDSSMHAVSGCQLRNYICIDLKNVLVIKHRERNL